MNYITCSHKKKKEGKRQRTADDAFVGLAEVPVRHSHAELVKTQQEPKR